MEKLKNIIKLLIRFIIVCTIISIIIVYFKVNNKTTTYLDENKVLKLHMLHIIFRHGSRTPADTYPNDPYINKTFYPIGWGQITNIGKIQLFKLGQLIRKQYNNFLGDYYQQMDYYCQSTDVDRTKVSIELVNAAIWPPKNQQIWNDNLQWQPIPIYYETLSEDSLLLVRKPCPQYHLELERIMKSLEIQEKLNDNKEIFLKLTELTGKNIQNFDDIQDLYSTLKAEDYYGLELPQWTRNYYPNILENLTIFSYTLNTYNLKLNRLKGGVLVKKIIENFENKINNNKQIPKTILYCGHDSTIVNLLSALNVWQSQLPDYGITIFLELLKNEKTQQFGVKLFLYNDTSSMNDVNKGQIFQLLLKNCEEFCEINKFKQLVSNVIPTDWENECKTNDTNYIVPTSKGP